MAEFKQVGKHYEMDMGSQILGLALGHDKQLIMASYFEPAFYPISFDEASISLNIGRAITPELSIIADQGIQAINLWDSFHLHIGDLGYSSTTIYEKDLMEQIIGKVPHGALSLTSAEPLEILLRNAPTGSVHRYNRAQVAQTTEEGILLYLQNGDHSIGAINPMTGNKNFFSNPSGKRIEYFTLLPDEDILAIENYEDCELVRYKVDTSTSKLVEKQRRSITEIAGRAADFMYGLCPIAKGVFMSGDKRSNLKGIHIIDNIDNLSAASMRKVSDTWGNGIALLNQALLVSQYTFNRNEANLGGPSKILYVPAKQ